MIGHSTLDFLLHYFTEYNPTLASALTILQVIHYACTSGVDLLGFLARVPQAFQHYPLGIPLQ